MLDFFPSKCVQQASENCYQSKANENGEIVVGIVKKQHEQANHGRANTIRHLVWWFAVSLKITQSGEVAWRMFRCGVCRTPQNRSISRVNKKDTFRQGDILLPPLEIRCSSPYNICVHNSLLQKVLRGIIMPICCVCGKKTLNCFIKDHKAYCKSCLKAAGMDSGAIMSRKLRMLQMQKSMLRQEKEQFHKRGFKTGYLKFSRQSNQARQALVFSETRARNLQHQWFMKTKVFFMPSMRMWH